MAKKLIWACSCGVTALYQDTGELRARIPKQRCLRCGEEGPK